MRRDEYAALLRERFGPEARAVHAYMADGDVPADHRGNVPCTCGLAQVNRIHRVPEQDDEVVAAEQRRIGQANEGER